MVASPRASFRDPPFVPTNWDSNNAEHRELIAQALLTCWRLIPSGTVTLAANLATTTLSNINIGPDSRIFFFPTTANAAAELGAGTMYVSAKANESATITHANNAQADRTFDYAIFGA